LRPRGKPVLVAERPTSVFPTGHNDGDGVNVSTRRFCFASHKAKKLLSKSFEKAMAG
jgi:hypothetical protein